MDPTNVSALHPQQSRWHARQQVNYSLDSGALQRENLVLISLKQLLIRRLIGQIGAPGRWDTERRKVCVLDADIVTQPTERSLVKPVTASNRIAANVDETLDSLVQQAIKQSVYHDALITHCVNCWLRPRPTHAPLLHRIRI